MPGVHELVVVANRLPVDQVEGPEGTPSWQPSPGGLVAALEPVMQRGEGVWIGWTGASGPAPEPFTARGMYLVPLELSQEEVEDYYEGMSNATLWPLYHDVIAPPTYHRHWWDAYVRVNQRFADVAAEQAGPAATVWVQDYQLQLVPRMLRDQRPDLRIGFFNHIPFPPYELYAQLPWRREVLDGLLGADLLGFQRPADANNLMRACRRIGLATQRGAVRAPGRNGERLVRCGAFPISVDAEMLDEVARRPEVVARAKEIRSELGDPEVVMLGVDRLDYTKGILHRLKAVEELFDEGRLSTPGTVFVQVATPSRENVATYQSFRGDVEAIVGRVNGDHGQLGHAAVHYLHQSLSREELAALYLAADVLLVTALRDGMNLVAKEYVATRHDERGALVLSEFTGAAIELPQAFLVNPHDIEGLKSAILRATKIPARESIRRMRAMRRQVFTHDVSRWANDFLRALRGAVQPGGTPGQTGDHPRGLSEELDAAVITLAGRASILVTVDFDGTLAPIVDHPDDARPLAAASAALARLAALPRTHVAVVSGRTLDDLRRLANAPDGALLIGGHGSEHDGDLDLGGSRATPDHATPEGTEPGRPEPGRPEPDRPEPDRPESDEDREEALLSRVTAALQEISATHNGTHVETKRSSAVLHTRRADRAVAAQAAQAALEGPAGWYGVHLLHGKEVVELSVSDVTKGTAVAALRDRLGVEPGGVLYIGDDVTDERAFEVLDQRAGDLAIKVGDGETVAGQRIADPAAVAEVLSRLADLRTDIAAG